MQHNYSLPLHDNHNTTQYCVRRLICIGRNYVEHAKEMGHNPSEAPPFFFYKPLTALCSATSAIPWKLPAYSSNVHYELELAIAIGNKVTAINPEQSICAAGLALDMTCRDIQQEAKKLGRPWEAAKGFDQSAPISDLYLTNWGSVQNLGDFTLNKNSSEVQRGNVNDMIWKIPDLLKQLLKYTELDEGDVILTGTPAGVGPVKSGDILYASIDGLPSQLSVNIT